jgi:hypothetical protein
MGEVRPATLPQGDEPMKVLGALKRLGRAVLIGWMAGCFLSFLSGFCFTLIPFPWGLPLPWSDFNDFAETPDGRVFVSLRFYNRALCYDRSGKFLAAHRFPHAAKATRLATGRDGRVYCRSQNKVYVYSPDWDLLSTSEVDARAERIWELDRDTGLPVHAPQRRGEVPPDRPLDPGDLLFGEADRREVFHCSDGSTLRRVGNGLERLSPEGEVVATYGTPWLLRPFVFPFPAVLAWVAIFALALWGKYRERRAARQGGTPPA